MLNPVRKGNIPDYTGQVFGVLTVTGRSDNDKHNNAVWNCICSCGNTSKVLGAALRSGHTKGCKDCSNKRKREAGYRNSTFVNLVGKKFGKLTVLSQAPIDTKNYHTRWNCLCDCGNSNTVTSNELNSGQTHCNVCKVERISKHGIHGHPLYFVHAAMLQRCYNPNAQRYKSYGGDGVKVCDEWHDVKTFYHWAIASGYKKGLSIGRFADTGNYEPSNCSWQTDEEQAYHHTLKKKAA